MPLAALAAAVIARHHRGEAFGPAFASALLQPRDWFSYWRLNCVLASYHALKTSDGGYALEDKLTFLQACAREGVAVSPWLKVCAWHARACTPCMYAHVHPADPCMRGRLAVAQDA